MYLRLFYIIVATITFVNYSCKNENLPDNDPRFIVVNTSGSAKLNDWIKKDSVVYGLVIYYNGTEPQLGKSVKCKVVDISKRGVKCQAMEKVSLFDKFNCHKIGVDVDEIWYDVPQDIFKTRAAADAFLAQKNLNN